MGEALPRRKRIGELKIDCTNIESPVTLTCDDILNNVFYYSLDKESWVKNSIVLNPVNNVIDTTVYFACAYINPNSGVE